MKKIIVLIALFTSIMLGQLKNTTLESKFEKDVLNEIEIIQNQQKSKSNQQVFKEVKPNLIGLDRNLRVLCRVRLNDIYSKSKLIQLGCEIKNETHNDVYVWIPIDMIEEVASLKEVLSIGSKGLIITNNSIISAGTSLHRTNLVYSTYGLTGSGVKVGVISDGMKYATVSQYNNELSYNVYAVDNTNDTTEYPGSEGTAMMEIIYDIAPSSTLWFGGINGSDTHLDFASRVTHLKQQGCKIIVDDIGYVIGYSYFQENEISSAIRQFIYDNNGCYISAAGNQHGKVYSGANYTVASDSFINFNVTTNELTFTSVDTGYKQITFQWADEWYYPLDDYDLYVYDNNNSLVFSSKNRGSGFPPEEYGQIHVTSPNSTYKIKVKWFSYTPTSTNREIKIVLWHGDFNFPLATKEKEIMGHQITDEVIGTAATKVTDSLNVEYFSAYGPARVYTSSGTISDIQQPKITAADSVHTFVGQSGNFHNPFSGTSAAAPHVAGIAALYFEMFPSDGYLNFKQTICNTSVTMNDGGSPSSWKKGSGYGRIDAYNAIEYRYNQNFVTMTINQKDSSGVNVDSAFIWQSNSWNAFAVPKPFVLLKSSTSFFKSKQSILSGQKYHDWNGLFTDVTNYKSFTIPKQSGSFTANFLQTRNNIQIKNVIDNITLNIGNIGFKDPWYIDTSDSKGQKNRGTIASARWYNQNSPFSPDYSTPYSNGYTYKGLFLKQGYDPQTQTWSPPYYSVKVDTVQNVNLIGTGYYLGSGRQHKFYFQNWSASSVGSANFQNANNLETPVVFNSDGATAQANLKGTNITNTQYNWGNGQRTFVTGNDPYNSYLHNVYCSMNKIWYERSADGGATWELMNDGDPINLSDNARSPSVSIYAGIIFITYQASGAWFPYAEDGIQVTAFYCNGSNTAPALGHYSEVVPNYNYSNEYRPVIGGVVRSGTVIYDMPSTSSEGLRGFYFSIQDGGQHDGDISKTGDVVFPTGSVNQYSNYPSIGRDHSCTHLVYEQNQTSIRYVRLDNSAYYTVSTGSSQIFNVKPTISVLGFDFGKVVISWIGGTYNYYGGYTPNSVMTRIGTINYTPDPDVVSWGAINLVGGNIQSVSSASNVTTPEKSLITWSYLSGTLYYSRWQRREGTTYTTPAAMYFSTPGNNSIAINGIWSQASTDHEFTAPKALVFNNSSQPYYYIPSTTNFVGGMVADGSTSGNGQGNVFLGKITEEDTIVTFGRSGVATINDIEFVFEIGDIVVGDSIIRFIDIPDTLVYTSTTELNQHTRTNNFTLTPNTNFYFSNIYHVVQKSDPDTALLSTDAVNFKAELVNVATNQVVGTFDNITYNKNNVEKYASIDYEVNCSGITAGEYYLRLVTSANGNASYTLANIFNENTTLAKKNFNKVNFTGGEIPATYNLAQNFPNPFNPSTTIRFQIPQDGIVTLKIYDILGAEVATLVNEAKVAGKYEVNFNAAQLSSGVYIYKIQSGDFVSSKKMLLLK